jgi:UDP:flavonoid glycosyltransferase YjiC (YdhE family)
MQYKKKIFVVVPSTSGHINPVICLVRELCKKSNAECVFYGNQENREQIERTGAQFRLYANRNLCELVHHEKTETDNNLLARVLNKFIDMSYGLVPQLIRDVRADKPDILIYDSCFLPAKYLLEIMKKEKIHAKEIEFYPNFAINNTLFNEIGEKKTSFSMIFSMFILFLRQLWFSLTFGINVYNPINLFVSNGNKSKHTKLVLVFPELQPYREEFDETFKFVGPCVSEQARSQSLKNDPELDCLLELFPPKGDSTKARSNDQKLIYMSLGTVFNDNPHIFENAFQAIREYDTKGYNLKSSQFRMVISLGEACYIKFKERIEKGDLKIPENILIRPKVPQLEILKRADIFITHCGMNSTSEAIKYAVPMIAIPLEGDQPMVAKRVCDGMSLGIRLNPLKFTVDDIGNAIDRVLSDEKFRKNIQKISNISAKYNGQEEGANIIMGYLN